MDLLVYSVEILCPPSSIRLWSFINKIDMPWHNKYIPIIKSITNQIQPKASLLKQVNSNEVFQWICPSDYISACGDYQFVYFPDGILHMKASLCIDFH